MNNNLSACRSHTIKWQSTHYTIHIHIFGTTGVTNSSQSGFHRLLIHLIYIFYCSSPEPGGITIHGQRRRRRRRQYCCRHKHTQANTKFLVTMASQSEYETPYDNSYIRALLCSFNALFVLYSLIFPPNHSPVSVRHTRFYNSVWLIRPVNYHRQSLSLSYALPPS